MNTTEPQVRSALHQAGVQLKLSAVLVNASWWLAVCLAWWLALFLLDNWLSLPAGLRLPLAIGGAALVAVGFTKKIYTVLKIKQRPERTAVLLEKRYGVADNVLINACQFEQQPLRPEEQVFAQQTVALGASWVSRITFAELWDRRQLSKWGTAALMLVFAWLCYIVIFPRQAWNAGTRLVIPLADRPPLASVTLIVTPPGDMAVVEGENLEIKVELQGKVRDHPLLVWKEGTEAVQPVRSKTSGEPLPMAAAPDSEQKFTYLFSDIRRPFAFRVFAEDAYSRSVQVQVKTLPRLKESVFRVTPPSYTGMAASANPGPPSSVSVLPGSKLELALGFEPAVEKAVWKESGQMVDLQRRGQHWECSTVITNAGEYEVEITDEAFQKNVVLAKGAVRLETDNPPEIDFVTDDRNRLVSLGNSVRLEVQARDDFGIQEIALTARSVESEQSQSEPPLVLKRWTYLGPPGNKGPLKESTVLDIDPARFKSDAAYLIEAWARDFQPGGQPGKSRPIMLRVKGLNEFALPSNDALNAAFEALRSTIARQEKANSLTANLKTYLEEALQKKSVADRRKSMTGQQENAQKAGRQTLAEFNKVKEGKSYATRLSPLVEGEMDWVLRDLAKLDPKDNQATLAKRLAAIENRQAYLLTELIALLGQIADTEQKQSKTNQLGKDLDTPPLVTADEAGKDLKDDLKKFMAAEQRILDRTKSLLDKGPQDLTEKDEQILGELAREEAQWAKFFEEKLTDWSKLPPQDFADSSVAKELNAVFQEIKMAAKELYEKKIELAVPTEQNGLENAKELVQNLERWLPDTPDNLKWNMEEPNTPNDIALAELPAELEDIVGDLIDKEDNMGQDVEDVTSPWMDSVDKGAGWGAMDGPISSMSAKGVTGNLLPNQMEIGGRSGEGRSGRSSGQMVQDTAEGKGGRETPTRVSPSPFEQGSVKDADTKSKGGATGGGKLSGAGGEGLRGPTPSQPTTQKMPRLADRQAKIRQEAEALALKLRGYHIPTGDLEVSINAMKTLEQSARRVDGLGVRRSFSRAVDALGDAKKTIRVEVGLHHERIKLPEWMRNEIKTGLQDSTPKGYEEMVSEYFKVLAEQQRK